jgi:hypothetical protein
VKTLSLPPSIDLQKTFGVVKLKSDETLRVLETLYTSKGGKKFRRYVQLQTLDKDGKVISQTRKVRVKDSTIEWLP